MTLVVHVEVCQRSTSDLSAFEVKQLVLEEIRKHDLVNPNFMIHGKDCSNDVLQKDVDFINCYHDPKDIDHVQSNNDMDIQVYVYMLQANYTDQFLPVARSWSLPVTQLKGLWESFSYDSDIKENLFRALHTALSFIDCEGHQKIFNLNRVVSLHGPSGTRKRSLCRALVQKLAIRFSHRGLLYFPLFEIKSHTLLTGPISETQSLVSRLFKNIECRTEHMGTLVCVLIGEVELLAHACKSSVSGTRPSDYMSVINALLTQLNDTI